MTDPRDALARGSRDGAIRAGSKSFALASRLFEPATRELVWDLYAWCRHCDDVVDGQHAGHGHAVVSDAARRLDELRRATDAVFAGTSDPSTPFGALSRVVAATALPQALTVDHLDGFACDVAGRRYDTGDELLEYCYHVAGVVGLMMAWIMGVRDARVLARASDLGIAFQLSNIARDVADDLRAGRVYLPAQWLTEAGVTLRPGGSLDATTAERLVPIVARLLEDAERYYASARHGIPHLPGRAAWAVATARLIYRAIGRRVRGRRAQAWSSRTVVGAPYKVGCLLAGGAQAVWLHSAARHALTPPRTGLFTPARIDVLR